MLSRRDLDNSWLFAPNERLEGTRLATVRLRPVRAALLVPDRDTKAAAAAVESCCLSWGGFANLIVPYSSTEVIREPWRKIIEILDPDLFVCFEDEPPGEVKSYLRSKGNRHVFSHGSYSVETLVTGTLIYAELDALMNSQSIAHKSTPLALPRYRGFPERFLPLLARYGSMFETTSFQNERYIRYIPGHRESQLLTSHQDYFEAREFQVGDHYKGDVTKMLSEVFIGDLSRIMPGGHVEEPYKKLPELTAAGLMPITPGSLENPRSASESRKYAGRVIILGDYADVEDISLFWTLRGQRLGKQPFPIFLPYRHVNGDRAKQLIEVASAKLAGHKRGSVGHLHITSAVFPKSTWKISSARCSQMRTSRPTSQTSSAVRPTTTRRSSSSPSLSGAALPTCRGASPLIWRYSSRI